MVDIKTIILKYSNIAKTDADVDEGKLIASSPAYAYEAGKINMDKRDGTKLTFLLDKNKFQTIDVKISGNSSITQDDIDKTDEGFIPVLIHEFKANLYCRDGKIYISAKASGIERID